MQKLCNPAKVYLVLEVISQIIYTLMETLTVWYVFFRVIFVVLWVFLLQFLYYTLGWETLSWILVLFPVVVVVLTMVFMLNVVHKSSQIEPESTVSTFCVGSAY